MIRLGGDRRETLELIRKVSLTGQAELGSHALLEGVCAELAEAFDLDRVAAARYHAEFGEVSEIAFAGAPAAGLAGRPPLASAPLLAQALERQALVRTSEDDAGAVTLRFALPSSATVAVSGSSSEAVAERSRSTRTSWMFSEPSASSRRRSSTAPLPARSCSTSTR